METERYSFIKWVKAHKKTLLLMGIGVTAIIGVIIGLKNKDAIMDLRDSLEDGIAKVPEEMPEEPMNAVRTTPLRSYTSPKKASDVRQHIRNLSGGKHHSAEKAAEAADLGISLPPNQTLVDSYTKYAVKKNKPIDGEA